MPTYLSLFSKVLLLLKSLLVYLTIISNNSVGTKWCYYWARVGVYRL